MLPTFLIIGSAKSGTTALHSYLAEHPEIHMSEVKETHYFADPSGYFPFGRIEDRESYEAQFDSPLQIRGETSPTYSLYPLHLDVPSRIHTVIPEARLIYLVRDPIKRMEALYRQRAAWQELDSFEETVGEIDDPSNEYISGSLYARQVNRYLEHFDSDRILIVDQDEMRHERRETLADVFSFLGADPTFWSDDYMVDRNTSAEKRRLPQSYRRITRSAIVRATFDRLPSSVRGPIATTSRRIASRPVRAPQLLPETEARWRELFAPEVQALRELSGRGFDSWTF